MKQKNNQSHLIIFLSSCFLMGTAYFSYAKTICPLDTLKPKKVNNLDVFRKIPVLNQGRIKPMESFAKNFLLQLSGRSKYGNETSIEWFARLLFAPRTTYDDNIFLINNPEILEAIRVEPKKRRKYSFNQLQPGYDKIKELAKVVDKIDEKKRSVVEHEILRVYGNLQYYIRLSGAFAYAFPHPDFQFNSSEISKALDIPSKQNQFSFYDMYERTETLQKMAVTIQKKDRDQWDEKDKIIAQIFSAMYFWTENYANAPIGIIPTISHQDEQWTSPMDIMRMNVFEETYENEVLYIRNMTIHYWNNEQLEFDLSARALINSVNQRLSSKEKDQVERINFELAYNKLNLFLWAKIFYILGFLFLMISLIKENRWLYRTIVTLTLLGFAPHLIALVLRMLILARPPVSNLYETFIFVGLVGALLGCLMEAVNKNWLGLFIANISGLIFLFIASKFANDGDTLQVLVAVLNSNFWLSTHVIAITIGYAGCSVAGIVGHIYILQAIFKPENKKQLTNTLNNMLGILGFGLTMTFLGTALGGIWADQSWGRFWGWDPKENGALLIVLWCAIIFHARLAKLIHPLGVAVGCVLGLIVVMWAWFGVNLLSVGLHSYGFTSGIANTLIAYALIEIVFIAVTVLILGKKNVKI